MKEKEGKLIYQVDDECKIVKTWDSVKQISKHFNKVRSAFDQSLREGCKSSGYFWIFKHQWILGKRPDFTKQKRNIIIFAYTGEDKKFIGKFKNAVIASKYLEISVSNIRCVCDEVKLIHRGFYFSYSPINIKDELTEFTELEKNE